MKISIDKTVWGLGVWWMRPDTVSNSETLLATLGPVVIRLYHKHNEAPVAPQDMQFR